MKQQIYFSEFIFNNVSTWPNYVRWGAIILTNVLLFWGAYVYSLQEVFEVSHNLQIENGQLEHTISQKKQQIKQKVFYQQQLQQLKAAWKFRTKQLLNINDATSIIAEINKIGLENHLQFKEIHPLTTKRKKGLIFLPIEIQVMGEYPQLSSFFSQLSQLTQWIELSDFLLTLTDVSIPKKLNLTFTVNVFANKSHKNMSEETVKNTMPKRDPFQVNNEFTGEEMLKNFPIETLRFVGYLQQNQHYLALMAAPNGCIYQAKIGTEVGVQGEKIIHINNDYIEVATQAVGAVKNQILKLHKGHL